MAIPVLQAVQIGGYVLRQKVQGKRRFPLVLMLEPLFRCNLACAGCGKIDYPDPILNQRLPLDECLHAMDECGAPVVVIAGGEPLLHKELPQIVEGGIARGKYITVCTNALLLEKQISKFKPHRRFNWSIHLDGDEEMHDKSVCQKGVYDRAVAALKLAKSKGFRVTINCTLFNDADPERVAKFLDDVKGFGIEGATVSPGYAYERAPDQQHFLNRAKTKQLFRDIFKRGQGGKKWPFFQSGLFLDYLAGNRTYRVHALGQPDAHGLRLAAALLSAGRGLRQNLRRTDGRDELGFLWCRQVREVRGLHGPLRLRGERRQRILRQAVGSAEGRHRRHPHRWRDGEGYPARPAETRRLRLLAARPEQAR